MSQAIVTEGKLVAIGDAIRQQLGTSVSYTLDEMASAIASISGGGGGGGGDLDAYIEGTLSELTTNASVVTNYCMYLNSTVKKITGNNVLSIGYGAFYGTLISQYSFPRATYIGSNAFAMTSISVFDFPSLTSAGDGCFSSCGSLKAVETTLGTIPSNMFTGCSQLSVVSIPNATSVNYFAFQNCSKVNSIYAPALVSVGSYAFHTAFTSTTDVDMPNVVSVGSSAFMNAKLRSLSLPLLNNLYNNAFANCSYLSELDLTNTKVAFRSSAFYSCSRLAVASINTGEMQNDVFYNCRKLSILDLNACSSVPIFYTRALSNTPMSNSTYLGYFGSIYVPASLYASFIASTNWAVFSARITSDPVPTT